VSRPDDLQTLSLPLSLVAMAGYQAEGAEEACVLGSEEVLEPARFFATSVSTSAPGRARSVPSIMAHEHTGASHRYRRRTTARSDRYVICEISSRSITKTIAPPTPASATIR